MKCHKVVFKGKLSDVILQIKNMRKRQDNCYIKHLKDENEKLKEIVNNRYDKELEYKNRIDKAIEYLDNVETISMLDGKIIFSINIFRNILQNGGKDNE